MLSVISPSFEMFKEGRILKKNQTLTKFYYKHFYFGARL